ncbi:hypothetical protein [uncultured Pseudodesulfovibrio sp.]|uniref:hypothetical protein n=1 Tax=uncultured Pseudodesulfovibrio sp. TaxID=2035858 RepID=UPI0029C79C98|nr:hypothetical protein [uncultured Pseudodesulfovibrio sp.]
MTSIEENQFVAVDASTFSGGFDFTDATTGIVYASEEGSSTGRLYYDPDDTQDNDEILLATIVEEDDTDLTADNIGIETT